MGISLLIGAVLALGSLIGAFYFFRKKRLVDDTPTSKTLGVFIGLAELKGTAESDAPVTSRLAEIPCVVYTWHVDEHWSRTVTYTTTDSKGHTTTHTRHESGWKTVANGAQSIPFYLKDDAGVIRIIPEGASIEDKEVFDKTVGRADPLYYNKGPAAAIVNSDFRRRFVEHAIPLHTKLYVMGQARERQDVVAAEIAKDKKSPMFLISVRTEKQVSSGFALGLWGFIVLGLLLALGGAFLANSGLPNHKMQLYAFASIGYLFVMGLGWGWTVYNSLVNLRLRVRQAEGQIDIQLKRRNDLIPNLVSVVDGYAKHEKGLQTLVTQLRDQLAAESGQTRAGCAATLKVALENYPDLKASELFLKLQRELSETEQRIALARDYFNDVAT
ncbi:MAG: LemA family protein, partial [Dehalococcoidales bacterium]|nr:LemA family protein [Dehalococcoidales bacterium]